MAMCFIELRFVFGFVFLATRKTNGALFLLFVKFSRSQSFNFFFEQLIELYITENTATGNSCINIRFSFTVFKEGAESGFVQSHLKDVSITGQIFAREIEDT
jgi:hypothetical protein